MTSMSYCRFQNTLRDLNECVEYLDKKGLSPDEETARRLLLILCRQITEDYEAEAERDQWKQAAEETELAYQEAYRECLDAREAVRRLAGELQRLTDLVGNVDAALIEETLADPVVRRIVEE